MVGGFYRCVGCGDFSIGTDKDRHACRLGRGSIRRRAKGYRSRFIEIAAEIVWKTELFLKRLVVARAVETDAEDNRVLVVECLDSITEPIAFNRSPGGVGFWIPPEKHVLPRVVVQRNRFAALVRHREPRRLLSNFYQGHVSPSSFFQGI